MEQHYLLLKRHKYIITLTNTRHITFPLQALLTLLSLMQEGLVAHIPTAYPKAKKGGIMLM